MRATGTARAWPSQPSLPTMLGLLGPISTGPQKAAGAKCFCIIGKIRLIILITRKTFVDIQVLWLPRVAVLVIES